ncbi:MAG: hypothetical protein MR773_03345 [Eubacterium coprostanoligenes]|uniref:Uncharacterized protein n=1 Tax=Eubacterium coprostanoligenes TaxID=290054 RepID=A0A1T4KLI5_9FIRM|nr:hypothetical protein [Eubacterium coprostanoligenes]MCI6360876.1 hypothetical protein [Eubacterium coprostanoligenes]MDD6665591.1 hypothetical protein [Eubacterium coprostanoligenes]MDD7358109.1 hypothetical protein [Eubacterium coprostanoligenes]MDY4698318.1 hypothetical protein [Eubacterium coprostanoligenes]SJZ43238.1 hypothetical protein SAMN02745114_00526 [Eubacterium coprostanoligenes]
MDNQKKEKKQGKLIPGSKVHVTTVAVISVILVILLAISSFGVAVFSAKPFEEKEGQVNVYELKSKLYTKAVIKALPKKITGNDAGKKIDFYIEENDNYDPEINEPVEQYRVYYYLDGKKVEAHGGVYKGDYETMYPLIGFFIKGMDNLKVLKKTFIALVVIVCIAIVALLIWLIALLIKVKEERKYSVSYQEQKLIKEAEKKAKKDKDKNK